MLAFAATAAAAQQEQPVEAVSLLGDSLRRVPLPDGQTEGAEARLRTLRAKVVAQPDDAGAQLDLGRTLANLGRFREAIAVLGDGARQFPADPWFLRFRGHRLVTTRRFREALVDLRRADSLLTVNGGGDEAEPPIGGAAAAAPGRKVVNTLFSSVVYHIGHACYMSGDFSCAAQAYARVAAAPPSAELRVASSFWLFHALRRRGDGAGAARLLASIPADLGKLEDGDALYLRLFRFYRGEADEASLFAPEGTLPPAIIDATIGYGLGVFALERGDRAAARRGFARARAGGIWAAFGTIAAEAELARDAALR